ncbi:MAG: hypothetical protein OEU26_16065, partial [Candidatus Tectomicrobia bacterium]|nr:hypothetical protein [Candidatus Tectomicrobia bacterium]
EASPAIAEHVETATTGVLQLEPDQTGISFTVVHHHANRFAVSFATLLESPTVQRLRHATPGKQMRNSEGEGATVHSVYEGSIEPRFEPAATEER